MLLSRCRAAVTEEAWVCASGSQPIAPLHSTWARCRGVHASQGRNPDCDQHGAQNSDACIVCAVQADSHPSHSAAQVRAPIRLRMAVHLIVFGWGVSKPGMSVRCRVTASLHSTQPEIRAGAVLAVAELLARPAALATLAGSSTVLGALTEWMTLVGGALLDGVPLVVTAGHTAGDCHWQPSSRVCNIAARSPSAVQ